MGETIVAVSAQPGLAPLVAGWLLDAFRHPASPTLEGMTARILAPRIGPAETFVLFDGGVPVGTASLARQDLACRPELTPWLAGVFVSPAARGRGHASALVRRVEAFAAAADVPRLWLYTWSAEGLYARLGWEREGIERDKGRDVVLMRRELGG
jgi:GNAT superfamily N-acetyltransferase